jgi:serine/threonine protein phosphatase 1
MLIGIDGHSAERGIRPEVVFLGDLTDRGPESRRAMNLVHQTLENWAGSKLIFGNHDEWFLETLRHEENYEYAESWITNGGVNTVMSYCDGEFPLDAMQQIRNSYPHHVEMLANAERIDINGAFIGVHAGVDPTRSLADQRQFDLNWIREPFLNFVDPKMPPVIHGHTIVGPTPVVTENRISIDTGAFRFGRLTACFVDAERKSIDFYQASKNEFEQVDPILIDRGYGTIYDRLGDIFGKPDEVIAPMTQEGGVYA